MQIEHLLEIDKELQGYEAGLYSASAEYKQLAKEAAEKRATYDVAFAQEMLNLKGKSDLKATVPEREAMAVVNVQKFMTDCRIAEAMAEGSKRHLATLQAILSSVQTRAQLMKVELSLNGRQV